MIARDDEALAHTYCQRGVPVQFTVYHRADHLPAGRVSLAVTQGGLRLGVRTVTREGGGCDAGSGGPPFTG